MKPIKFRVHGDPTSKGRPRFNRMTGRTYTPQKTAEAERDFKVQALQYAPEKPFKGPIRLTVEIYKKRPKSRKGQKYCVTRPDLDNYAKLAGDALNNIFWEDDSQVVEIIASKYYDDVPYTIVEVEEIEEK